MMGDFGSAVGGEPAREPRTGGEYNGDAESGVAPDFRARGSGHAVGCHGELTAPTSLRVWIGSEQL